MRRLRRVLVGVLHVLGVLVIQRLTTATGSLVYDMTGRGRWLLLLHPVGADRRMWSALTELLAPRFRCIAPDQRGWGESDSQQQPCDRLADLQLILADCAVNTPMIIVAWGQADTAVSLCLGQDYPVAGTLLFNPTLGEYLHPRDPHYLGDAIGRSRDDNMREVASYIRAPGGLAGAIPAIVESVAVDRDRADPANQRARQITEEMSTSVMARGREPQSTLRIRVADRLALVGVLVELIVVAPSREPGVADACGRALAAELPHARSRRIISSWAGLFPLGHPEQAAQLIDEFAGRLTDR